MLTLILKKTDGRAVTLDELPLGQLARVTGTHGLQGVTLRLMEMGLVPGAQVELRKRAPWGGPLELKVEGYLLTVRRRDAQAFEVRAAEDTAAERSLDAVGASAGGRLTPA